MFANPHELYKSKEWQKLLEELKLERTNKEGQLICEYCGRNMVIKQGRFGKFLACPGYPECKNAKPLVESIDIPCPKCGGKILVKKTKKRRTFYVCENSPKTCDYISWNKPKKETYESDEDKVNKTKTKTKTKSTYTYKTKSKTKTKKK